MLSQSFAMIGGHDQERSFEHGTALQFVEQLAQPLVQVRKAVVIAVSNKCSVVLGQPQLVDLSPALEYLEFGLGPGHTPKAVRGSWRKQVERMGIKVIEEREEGSTRLRPL